MSGMLVPDSAYFSERGKRTVSGGVKFRTVVVLAETGAPPCAWLAMTFLLDHLNARTGACFPSAARLAKRSRASVNTARRGLTWLKQNDWIRARPRKDPDGGWMSNDYDVRLVFFASRDKEPASEPE